MGGAWLSSPYGGSRRESRALAANYGVGCEEWAFDERIGRSGGG